MTSFRKASSRNIAPHIPPETRQPPNRVFYRDQIAMNEHSLTLTLDGLSDPQGLHLSDFITYDVLSYASEGDRILNKIKKRKKEKRMD